ncbi:hypothetical protein [Paulownia witches'-broom phytoplasma]|nr:hypothetical protein [Paulownia witches'-broom phytoplasma]
MKKKFVFLFPKKLRYYLMENNVNFYKDKENNQYETVLQNFFKNHK